MQDGWTALVWATAANHTATALALIAAKADVNIVAKVIRAFRSFSTCFPLKRGFKQTGGTALMRAVQQGNVELVHALLSAKADRNALNKVGAQLSNLWKLGQSKPRAAILYSMA
jgi:ankyrin repeat protein